MMKRVQNRLLIVILVVTALSLILWGCAKQTTPQSSTTPSPPPATQTSPTTTPAPTLSEEPDKATFRKYFSVMDFGRVPVDSTSPADFEKNVTVFSPGDQIALFFTSTQEVLVRTKIYNTEAKEVTKEGGFPKPLKGNYGGWEPLDIPAGKYEYKVYAGDVLVAIFPFEVR